MSEKKEEYFEMPLRVLVVDQDSDLENVARVLSNNIYMLSVKYFEKAETAGLISGNGHHMAQELGTHAKKMLLDRVKQMKDIKK